jgi:hypothetical protein
METGARTRGLAGWARERALGDRVSRCGFAAAKVPGTYTRMTAHSVSVGAQRASARRAILIGPTAIRNPRIPLKPHAMFFSNRSKIACLRAGFAQVSRTTNRQSHLTTRAFLIATQLLEIELTSSQQKRKLFLIATFSAILHGTHELANQEIGVPRGAQFTRHLPLITGHCPNESLAKHNRKPSQLIETNHQRPKSIASFVVFFTITRNRSSNS